jgi:undecaprenyl-diphosphatase
MLGMPPARFLAVNIVSALLWAPVHILPGVVFGASIELAGAVSFRLVVLLAVLVAFGWAIFQLARLLASHARGWTSSSRRRLLDWAQHRTGAVARLVLRALDPHNSALGLILGISVLLLASAAVFFSTLGDVSRGDPLVQVDMSTFRFLQSFRSEWGDAVLSALSTLGSAFTLVVLAVLVVIWMGFEKRWRTLAYWLGAVVFSQVLVLAIQITTKHPMAGQFASGLRAFPSDHVAASVVIYGFLAFLLARRVNGLARVLVVTVTIAIVIAVAFSGLYFGRFALSDAVGGAALAAAWVFFVALTAVWRNPGKPRARAWMPAVVLAVIGMSVALQSGMASQHDTGSQVPSAQVVVITPIQWTDTVWRKFSCYRSSMEGDRREPITVQWAATEQQIGAQLRSKGWTAGPHFSASSLLSLVSPAAPATALPALPKLNNGEPSAFVFIRAHKSPDERDVLRFWPTAYALAQRGQAAPAPIWLGSLVHEHVRRNSWPFNVLRPDKEVEPMIPAHSDPSAWQGLEVARSTGCGGAQVALIESAAQ